MSRIAGTLGFRLHTHRCRLVAIGKHITYTIHIYKRLGYTDQAFLGDLISPLPQPTITRYINPSKARAYCGTTNGTHCAFAVVLCGPRVLWVLVCDVENLLAALSDAGRDLMFVSFAHTGMSSRSRQVAPRRQVRLRWAIIYLRARPPIRCTMCSV